jgi:ATP-dependent Clp protease ATP-binding subunit ClpA
MADNEPDRISITLERAVQFANSLTHEYVTLEHLLFSMIEESDVSDLLTGMEVDAGAIAKDVEKYLKTREDITNMASATARHSPRKTVALSRVFNRAITQVIFSGRTKLFCRDVIISLLSETDSYAYFFLAKHGVTREGAIHLIQKEFYSDKTSRVTTGDAPPVVKFEDYCMNLNVRAAEGHIDPVIGREDELIEITEVLARRKKNNVIIVGEPGVGKTAIAEGLALMITEGKVPEILEKKVVYSLDIASLVAGTKYRGEFEERAKVVFEQLATKTDIILFIDEIHMIMGAGSAGGSNIDIANLLKPLLASGKLFCVGATTSEEYRENFEKDRALQRRFQKVVVDQPSKETTKLIIRGLKQYYEAFHEYTYDEEALDMAVELAERYMHGKYNPDRVIDVMDTAGARAKLHKHKGNITVKQIEEAVSKITRIPIDMIDAKENTNYVNLESNIKTKLFGQDKAVSSLVESILVSKSGMRERNKPIGSFLFVGPTGTGKTELCRQLASNLSVKLRKYDMSEYMEQHSVSKLIGAPPGYVGHAEGGMGAGQLINDVEESPNCIVLLDEVEKAHPSVMNLLLQVMDDGKLTGSTGKEADFSNVILIMTSNLGSATQSKQAIGFSTNNNDASYEAVKKFFSPEFRNRIDATIEFNSLEKNHIDMIVDKTINEINEMIKDKKVTIVLSDPARIWLRERGYVPEMGARPLQRVVNDNIKKPISKEILFGKLREGGTVTVDIDGKDEIKFVYT